MTFKGESSIEFVDVPDSGVNMFESPRDSKAMRRGSRSTVCTIYLLDTVISGCHGIPRYIKCSFQIPNALEKDSEPTAGTSQRARKRKLDDPGSRDQPALSETLTELITTFSQGLSNEIRKTISQSITEGKVFV